MVSSGIKATVCVVFTVISLGVYLVNSQPSTSFTTPSSTSLTHINLTTSVPKSTTNRVPCDPWEEQCDSGECHYDWWFCDGEADCIDGSDETSCEGPVCESSDFECSENRRIGENPICLHQVNVCDDVEDCRDGADEVGCVATQKPGFNCTEFYCESDDSCISVDMLCNHRADCFRGEDERNCTYEECTTSQFTCPTGHCIDITKTCDGRADCPGGADEDSDMCADEPGNKCSNDVFTCNNTKCLDAKFLCDGSDQCGDNSDETICNSDLFGDKCKGSKCTGQCVSRLWGYYCKCDHGQKLKSDGYTCRNVDGCNEQPIQCSQQCNYGPDGVTCSCADGYIKDILDASKCVAADKIEPYLVFGNYYYLRNLTYVHEPHTMDRISSHHSYTRSQDFDYKERMFYYADLGVDEIRRMTFEGEGDELINNDFTSSIEGIAVEWVSKKLYWTSYTLEGIYVSELNGTSAKALFKKHSEIPRDVAVHPGKGTLYWTDWSYLPHIGIAGLDGSNVKKIVTTGIYWPNGIAIDFAARKLFWVDAHFNRIEFTDLDGNNRQVAFESVPHGYSLSLFEDSIFYTEWNLREIWQADKYTGNNRKKLLKTTHSPYDIHVIHPLRQPEFPNPCGSDNGGCSHLCLISPGTGEQGTSYTCVCPNQFILQADGKTCQGNCTAAQFLCGRSDHKCIPKSWFCDKQQDCRGGEDEPKDDPKCINRVCSTGYHQCDNKECVYQSDICNLEDDCGDGSDEIGCTERECLPYQFRCDSGQCITASYVCDEDDDCDDASDETEGKCQAKECNPITEFRCNNSLCIPKTWTCDWDDDCGDQSDEPKDYCWHNYTCPDGWLRCTTNYRCIPSEQFCDGENDCRDNSDENIIRCPKCDPVGDFTCGNGECIPKRWVCDGDVWCTDGSDEHAGCKPRSCTEVEFKCPKDGKCLSPDKICDLKKDCSGNEDEEAKLCSSHKCPAYTDSFQCKSGHCAKSSYRCDGYADCPDASDEGSDCPPRLPNNTYCSEGYFTCEKTKVCVYNAFLCDGDDDCKDGSDETQEQCEKISCTESWRFRCKFSRKCIYSFETCDKKAQCGPTDSSDEDPHTTCKDVEVLCDDDEIKCKTNSSDLSSSRTKCIRSRQICDGNKDCDDSSDEANCQTGVGLSCLDSDCQQDCVNVTDGYLCKCMDGFKVKPTNKKQCLDVDECSEYNLNVCPHMCTNMKGSYVCSCHAGFIDVHHNGKLCVPKVNQSDALLMAMRYEIRQYFENTKKYVDAVMTERRVEAIALDITAGTVYWADSSLKTIKRAVIPKDPTQMGISQELIKMNSKYVTEPTGIAYDWIGQNVFWTNAQPGAIYAMTSDGNYIKTMLRDDSSTFTPAYIVIDSNAGYMFWLDLNPEYPKIERAFLSGKERVQIVTKNLYGLRGLTIDYYKKSRLFWTDVSRKTIESCEMDGTGRLTITSDLSHQPYSIDVFSGYLYWTSIDDEKIYKMDKFGRHKPIELLQDVLEPKDLKVYHPLKYNTSEYQSNPCINEQGKKRCDALCLPESNGMKQCGCPDGYQKTGEKEGICISLAAITKNTPPPELCSCNGNGYCVLSASNPVCHCYDDTVFKGHEKTNCLIPTTTTTTTTKVSTTTTTSTMPTTISNAAPTTATDTYTTSIPTPYTQKPAAHKGSDNKNMVPTVVAVLVIVFFVIVVVFVFVYLYKSGKYPFSRSKNYRANPNLATAMQVESADNPGQMQNLSIGPTGDVKFTNLTYEALEHGKEANNSVEETSYNYEDSAVLTDKNANMSQLPKKT